MYVSEIEPHQMYANFARYFNLFNISVFISHDADI